MEVGIKLSIFVDGLVLLHEQNTIDRSRVRRRKCAHMFISSGLFSIDN